MRRSVLLALCAVLAVTACSEQRLGRAEPACDPDRLGGAIVLAAQSVPGTAYAPCIDQLSVGWSYEHLVAESGQSRFWLNSDRVGSRFLQVTMEASCDLDDAVEVTSDEPGIARYEHVVQADVTSTVAIVPEGDEASSHRYAEEIATDVEGTVLAGRQLQVTILDGPGTTEDRIASALAEGHPVIVAGPRGEEEATVELQVRAGPADEVAVDRAIPLAAALEQLETHLAEPRYRATWYYVFEGGCVTYEFDAHGPSVATVTTDVERALGFLPLAGPREQARREGYVVP
jgi:hypothetical protein